MNTWIFKLFVFFFDNFQAKTWYKPFRKKDVILYLVPSIRIFLRIRIREAKMLRIQRFKYNFSIRIRLHILIISREPIIQ